MIIFVFVVCMINSMLFESSVQQSKTVWVFIGVKKYNSRHDAKFSGSVIVVVRKRTSCVLKLIVRRVPKKKKTYMSENIRAMEQNITDTDRLGSGGLRVKGNSVVQQLLDVVKSSVRRHRARRWTPGGSRASLCYVGWRVGQANRACGGNHDRERPAIWHSSSLGNVADSSFTDNLHNIIVAASLERGRDTLPAIVIV